MPPTPGPADASPRLLSTALAGCAILIAVDRRSSELTAALERHGATVQQAAALTIESHIDDATLIARTRELIAHPPDIVVATTGVGFRGWMEAAQEADLADELAAAFRGAQLVARGPKARGAIQQAGLTADWVAESETAAELGAYLVAEGVTGKRVAVQHHGSGADGLDELFTAHGADVVSLTVYRWGPPPDPALVRRSVVAAAHGEYDAVLFTSAPGAAEWLAEAERAGVTDAIRGLAARGRLLMTAVGPVTAEPLRAAGVETLVAERGRLGSLVRAVVTHFGGGHAPSYVTPAGRLELRSGGAVLGGRVVALSPAGADVLSALFDAGGGVVSRAELQRVLPRSGQSANAVEMAVARLREALGAPDVIKTVVKRGYRLNVED
ncbi:uroporphyrinogen-III synthase [Microbacterium album]|uniref:Transcriptional regulatory protein n=1 Tax=Microbacterium album TaxID=2053191 RepID=A0A917IEU6_9MICO|nr:uroporphyrinogen-III synthase [Microbacterium album]GGH39473.1 putative transcriptional regulatory protein [Microbacterium album]